MNETIIDQGNNIESFAKATSEVIEYLPSLGAAVLVLLLGFAVGRVARSLVRRFIGRANSLLDHAVTRGWIRNTRFTSRAPALSGQLVFWGVMFLSITVAARLSGLVGVFNWLNQIVVHLPNIILGASIVVLGYFVSLLVGDHIAATARNARVEQFSLVGRFAQGALFATAIIVGLDQIGIDVTFLVAMIAISAGSLLVGFSIAFGLGARDFVSNLVGARSARRTLDVGDRIRIDGVEGEVSGFSASHLIVETEEGRVLLPAHRVNTDKVLIVPMINRGDFDHEQHS